MSGLATVLWMACSTSGELEAPVELQAVVDDLDQVIRYEMHDQDVGGVSIAVFGGDRVVWARGYGRSTPRTEHRAGSLSKLFTAVAVLQAVERGELDLDAPVRLSLPEFAPRGESGAEVTLRGLLSHQSGLPREPRRGGYFSREEISLAECVASLGPNDLVYEPGARFKYSNAGPAVAGLVLARRRGSSFEDVVADSLLRPLGLIDTAFDRDIGITPAVGLRSTAIDLARFAGFVVPARGLAAAPGDVAGGVVLGVGVLSRPARRPRSCRARRRCVRLRRGLAGVTRPVRRRGGAGGYRWLCAAAQPHRCALAALGPGGPGGARACAARVACTARRREGPKAFGALRRPELLGGPRRTRR